MKSIKYIIECPACSQQYFRTTSASAIFKCQKRGSPMWCNDCKREVRGKFVQIVKEK